MGLCAAQRACHLCAACGRAGMPRLCAVRGAADMPSYALQRNSCMPLYALLAGSRVCQKWAIAESRGSSSYALQRNRCMPSLCAASGAAGMPVELSRNRGEALSDDAIAESRGGSSAVLSRNRGEAQVNALCYRGIAGRHMQSAEGRLAEPRGKDCSYALGGPAESRHHCPLFARGYPCAGASTQRREAGGSKVTCAVPFVRANILHVLIGIRGGYGRSSWERAHTWARGGYPSACRQRAFTGCPRNSILGPPRLG